MHISSLFLPLLILLELPTPAFSLLPFPYPYCPYSPGLHPHTPLQWGQVVAIVITCSYWLQRSFCLVLWTGSATQLFTRPHSIGCENNRYRNTAMTLSPKQWSCVLWRTNEIRGFKSCVLTAWTRYAAWPKRYGSRSLVTPFRLGHVAEVNWPRRPGKTL